MSRLASKVALITGAGTGIGAATARRFAAEGARVLLVGRRREPLETVAAELSGDAVVISADAADDAAMAAAVDTATQQFGRLDIVVANAGTGGGDTVGETSRADWDEALRLNVTTCYSTVRPALPALRATRGSVIIVGSIAGLSAPADRAGYVTGKHALIGLTRSLAVDYGPQGIRVNAICPGQIRTPMSDNMISHLMHSRDLDDSAARQFATRYIPLGRQGEPEEIAGVCLFLASADSTYLTGSVLVADGGVSIVDPGSLDLHR
ncbi:SDR family NAD(P)-dependent oxidoreductase [Nocardia brasiliensis]|uniref:SDR family NAD(P)-dependent oxidoreductase n=1 Tax=Nocardia brasiliensis TaxID=37326 RepID=UPI00366B2381